MNEPRPIACAYIRVNAADQPKRDISLKSQLLAIQSFCRDHGLELVEVVEEAVLSTPDSDRPQFRSMIDRATGNRRPFDIIVVHSVSRFARDHARYTANHDRLQGADVVLLSVEEGRDELLVSSANFPNINHGGYGGAKVVSLSVEEFEGFSAKAMLWI